LFYTLFFLLAIIQFWLFGQFFAAKIKKVGTDMETAGDILGKAYGKYAQILTGLLTIFFSIAIVAVLGVGGGKVISSITSIPLNMSIVFIVSFITVYSFYGGIATVIKTDNIQFYLICIFAILGVVAGIVQLGNNSNIIDPSKFLWNSSNMSTSTIIGTAIAFFLGEAFLPVYSLRGLISRDPKTAKISFKNAAYFGFVWFLVLTFIGITAHYANNNFELAYLNLIKTTFSGIWGAMLIGIAIAGMLSVVMSTLDSILNSAGVSFRKDIISQIFITNEKQKLSYTRLAILLISALGVFVTIFSKDIVGLLLWAYTLWVPAIIFPLAYYLLKGEVNNKNSGLLGMIFGIVGWLFFEFFVNTSIPAILVGLCLNILVVMFIEKKGRNGYKLQQ
jgi:SSS family solute:Na+ symporter